MLSTPTHAEFCILVVDDEEQVTRALAASLSRSGYRVITCIDPTMVLPIVGAERVDLVISDENMPAMSGVALLRQLRESYPDVVRVLLTGSANIDTAAQAINDAGVFKFLSKPWRPEMLDHLVQAAVQRSSARRPPSALAGERRRAMREELEDEHPGILQVQPGVYLLHGTSEAGGVDDLMGVLLSERESSGLDARTARALRPLGHPTDLESHPAGSTAADDFARLGPVDLADALFAGMVRYPELSLAIEPSGSTHSVSMELGPESRRLLRLPHGLGDALAARCALVAGLDPAGIGEQNGPRAFALAGEKIEIMVTFRTSSDGLAAELRRVEVTTGDRLQVLSSLGHLGPYRILDILGHGGLGIVYRAVHEVLERHVAIKVLHAAASDTTSAARFLREARAASRAKHPGIVDVLEFGRCVDGRAYLVMELVESPTLEQRLARGALPLREATAIAHSIAGALSAAHEAGVVHRDLKPSNIFVDDGGHAKLTDFGAAKMVGTNQPALTAEGTTIGTPHYMAPEQARGAAVDRRADLYALGCILFEMVAGVRAYDGESPFEVFAQHVNKRVPTPTSPFEPVPHALVRVIRRAMAKNPEERHQTAAELNADLVQAERSLGRSGWRRWLP